MSEYPEDLICKHCNEPTANYYGLARKDGEFVTLHRSCMEEISRLDPLAKEKILSKMKSNQEISRREKG